MIILTVNVEHREFNPVEFRVRLTNEETDISTVVGTFPTIDQAVRYSKVIAEITGATVTANQPV